MKWYYTAGPAHTRVRVIMNGAYCGALTFRNEEFAEVRAKTQGPVGHHAIGFINEALPQHTNPGPQTLRAGHPLTPKEEADVF